MNFQPNFTFEAKEAKQFYVEWNEPKKFGKANLRVVVTKDEIFLQIKHDHKEWSARFERAEDLDMVRTIMKQGLVLVDDARRDWLEMRQP